MVAQVRSFNRTVTLRAGALNERFLARDRPLAQSRMLWEIGVEGCQVRLLRSRLRLDSGHASRLLRALEGEGLVRVTAGVPDRRVRVARLTGAGLAERDLLDRRADHLAISILEELEPTEREQLVGAMRTVQHLLTSAMIEIRTVDPAGRDAAHCLAAYFDELDRRSGNHYDPAAGVSAEPHELVAPAGAFLIAYLRDEPIGCGAVKHHACAATEIKRMWVAESARGLGIGRRLLVALEACALRAGAPAARLETNGALVEAIAMYRSAGYVEIAPFNDEPFAEHWFEKPLP